MDLVTVEDASEDAFFAANIDEDTFIGASDQATEGEFVWVSQGQPFWAGGPNGAPVGRAYTNWQSSQPSDGLSGRDCVVKEDPGGMWSTLTCATSEAFACERKASSTGLHLQSPFGELPADAVVATQGVGHFAGSSQVAPDGSFAYKIPIRVPPGRAGLAPELAVEYHSRGGNGLLGVGWSFRGFSEIRRCAKSTATDSEVEKIQFDATDAYCIEGQKLRLTSGTHGADGSAYQTDLFNYSKIVARGQAPGGGPEWFEVFKKDGQIWEYGRFASANGSRADTTRHRRNNLGEEQLLATSVTLAWALSRIRDRSGNTIEYQYTTDEGARSTLLPRSIRYTNSPNGSLYESGTRLVRFITESRPDQRRGYMNGVRTGLTQRLLRIEVSGRKPTGGDGIQPLWSYEFKYQEGPVTRRTRLDEVKWCDSSGICYPPIKIQWQQETLDYSVTGGTASAQSGPGWSKDHNAEIVFPGWTGLLAADITGDGNDDILYNSSIDPPVGNGTGTVLISDGFGGFQQEVFTGGNFSAVNIWKSTPVDFDHDGRVDLIAAGSFNTGVGYQLVSWDPVLHKMVPRGVFRESFWLRKPFLLADLNGDKQLDLLEAIDREWRVRLYQLDEPPDPGSVLGGNPIFSSSAIPTGIDSGHREDAIDGKATFFDEDGDGRTELHALWGTAHSTFGLDRNEQVESFIFDLDAYNQDRVNNRHPLGTSSSWRFMDINGDGLKDAVSINRDACSLCPEMFEARINTGLGFDAVYNPGNPADLLPSNPRDVLTNEGIRIVDFNGDGMDDILVFDPGSPPIHFPNGLLDAHTAPPHVLLSDGRNFTRVDLPSTGALRVFEPSPRDINGNPLPGCGWCSSQIADIDSNGTPDVVQLVHESNRFKLQVLRRDQRAPADLVHKVIVGEDPTVSAEVRFGVLAEGVREDTARGDPMLFGPVPFAAGEFYQRPPGSCDRFAGCAARGITAVRAYRSQETNGHDGFLWYSYTGARVDTGGRGFLGFEHIDIGDPQRKSWTALDFEDHSLRIDLRTLAGLPGYAYPFANRLTASMTLGFINPVVGQDNLLHSVVTDLEHDFRIIGSSYDVNVKRQDIYRAIHDSPLPPFPQILHQSIENTYDAFGNVTDRTIATEGGASERVHTTFDNDAATWLIGLPRRREVTAAVPTATGGTEEVKRTTAFDYYPSGLLHRMHREPDMHGVSDPALLYLRTTLNRDEAGLVRSVEHAGDPASVLHVKGDAAARITKIDYDEDGVHQHRIENALGHVEWFGYHPSLGVPLIHVDANNVETRWKYDAFGRLRQHSPGGGERVDVDYLTSAIGEVEVRATFAGGGQAASHLDPFRRELRRAQTGFNGSTVMIERNYDALGRVRTETLPRFDGAAAHTVTYSYDQIDRLLRVDNADSSFKERSYTGLDTVTEWDEKRNKSQLKIDHDGWVVESTNFDTSSGPERLLTTLFTHAPFGLLRDVTRQGAAGPVMSSYFYDRLGRLTRIVDPDAGTRNHGYNPFDELQAETNAEAQTTTLARDKLGRVSVETAHDGKPTAIRWDTAANGIGMLHATETSGGVISEYAYDSTARPRSKLISAASRTLSTEWTYDAVGRMRTVKYPRYASTPDLQIQYEYDTFGFLDKVLDTRTPNAPLWDAAERDAFGNVVNARSGQGVSGEAMLQRAFDPATGRLASQTVKRLGVDIQAVSYAYHPNGSVDHVEDATRGTRQVLSHDSLDRLTGWRQEPLAGAQVPSFDFRYTYDDLGNPTGTTESTTTITRLYSQEGNAGPHAVTSFGQLSFTYDPNGRLKERLRTGQAELRVDYTDSDLPSRIENLVQPALTTSFEYDGEDNRVVKQNSARRTFHVGGLFELHEDLSTGGAPAETGVFHVYAEGEEVARIERSVTGEKLRFVQSDRLGSVAVTSSAGAAASDPDAVERLRFDPFGQLVDERGQPTAPAGGAPLTRGYTGHEHDTEFGLINMAGRIYDPNTRRFLTPDPIVQAPRFGQSHNPYSYVFNSPSRYVDPTGLEGLERGAGVIGDGQWDANPDGSFTCFEHNVSCAGGAGDGRPFAPGQEWTFVFEPGDASDFDYQARDFELARNQSPPFQGERWNPYEAVIPGTSLFGSQFERPDPAEREFAKAVVGFTPIGDLLTLQDPRADSFDKAVAAGSLVLTVASFGVGMVVVKGAVKSAKVGVGAARGAPRLGQGLKGTGHALERHVGYDIAKYADKSKFNVGVGESVEELIQLATHEIPIAQANGYVVQTVNVGREIGFDAVTRSQTTFLTVVSRADGTVVTAYPGLPW